PAPRYRHAMAFDSVHNQTLLTSGSGASGYEDTWAWDGAAWTQVSIGGAGGAMAFDSQRAVAVSNGFGLTLEWNGTTWAERAISGPSLRSLHGTAFDSQRGVTVLFGGAGGPVLGDTWEWDGTVWTQRLMGGGPTPRDAFGMAFDAQRARTLLFGGYDGL